MNDNRLNKKQDSFKLINKIKIWPMMTNLKPKEKKEDHSPAKPDPVKIPNLKLEPLQIPQLVLAKSSSEKIISFPDITSLCTRLKENSQKHSHSPKTLSLKPITEQEDLKKTSNRLSSIDEFIKTCEIEKNIQKNKFIDGIDSIQNEMINVVGFVQKITNRPKLPNPKRKKENDCYYTRVQIRKLINELRACTKHISN